MKKQDSRKVLRYYFGGPIYVFGGPVFLIALFIISQYIVGLSPIGIALCTLIVAIPILFNGVYHASTSRILFLQGLRSNGTIFRFCSGYVVRLLLHTILGLCAAIVLVTELLYSPPYHVYMWGSIVLAVILLPTAYSIAERIVHKEALNWLTGKISLTIAGVTVALIVTVVYSMLTNLAIDSPIYETWQTAVASQPQFSANEPSIGLLFDFYNQVRGIAQYAFGLLRTSTLGTLTYVVFYEAMLFLFFVGITSAMSTFCLPKLELKRAVGRPTTAASPCLSWPAVAISIAIVLAVSTGYVYSFWGFSREVEHVHDQLVRRGTMDLLEQAKQRYENLLRRQLSEVSASGLEEMESSVDTMIATMRSNVDGFLDWYYSPLGEAFRITSRVREFVSRHESREEQLVERLYEDLLEEVPIVILHRQWEILYQVSEALIEATREQFNVERDQIIASNVVDRNIPGPTTKVEQAKSPEFDIADDLQDNMKLQREAFLRRQNSSLVFGVVGGAVAATVVARTVFKRGLGGVDKLVRRLPRVARPLARSVFLGSRVLAASSGVGLLVMVALTGGSEYVLLKFHEKKDRPQFKDRIMDAIDLAEQELKAELQGLLEY